MLIWYEMLSFKKKDFRTLIGIRVKSNDFEILKESMLMT